MIALLYRFLILFMSQSDPHGKEEHTKPLPSVSLAFKAEKCKNVHKWELVDGTRLDLAVIPPRQVLAAQCVPYITIHYELSAEQSSLLHETGRKTPKPGSPPKHPVL